MPVCFSCVAFFNSRSGLALSVLVLTLLGFAGNASAAADTTGTRQIYLQDAHPLSVQYQGPEDVVQALNSGSAPLAFASGDLDADGVSDLAVGYGSASGGIIVIYKGNLDAFAPQTQESWQGVAEGRYPSPFRSFANVLRTPIQPDFVALGDFNKDGHADILIASRSTNSVYILAGNGTGQFSLMAAYLLPGNPTMLGTTSFDGVTTHAVVGWSKPSGAGVSVFAASNGGLTLLASSSLRGPATSIAFGDLDGDFVVDAAVIADNKILILHGSDLRDRPANFNGSSNNGNSLSLESVDLPFSASAVAVGSFIQDRDPRQQMAVLASDGSVNIVTRQGIDTRPWTTAEMRANRLAMIRNRSNALASRVSPASEPWKVSETFPNVSGANSTESHLLLATRISSQPADDIMVLDATQRQMVVIAHPDAATRPTRGVAQPQTYFPRGTQMVRSLADASPFAALAARVNVDGRPGVIVLRKGEFGPAVMMPLPDPTFTVNTTNDTVDAHPGDGICADAANHCSLRAAIMEANAIAGVDTIMVPAGTYTLTIAGREEDGALTGDLDITDGVNIVGAGPSTTIVQAGTNPTDGIDKVFSINPLLTTAFDTSISNLTIRFGLNNDDPNGPAPDSFGGAFDWEASGTGTLSVTNCVISNNSVVINNAGLSTFAEGGGIAATNGSAGPGTFTISGSTIESNTAQDVGGGIFLGGATIVMSATLVQSNSAAGVGAQQGGGLFIFPIMGSTAPAIHASTIHSNSSQSDGGGIYTTSGLLIDQGTSISNNQSGRNGGGLWSNLSATVRNATITGNVATVAGGGIRVDSSATGNDLAISFSRIVGNTAPTGNGVDNVAGTVTATENWWGCNTGPSAVPCDLVAGTVSSSPWIVLSNSASPSTITVGGTSTLSAGFVQDSAATPIPSADLTVFSGLPITFGSAVKGSISNAQGTIQPNGIATATFTATAGGVGSAVATVDSGSATATITIQSSDLTITKSHTGNFTQGQLNAAYTITVSNAGPAGTAGVVSVVDTLPVGLTATAMSGTGWTCTLGTATCTRSDVLNAATSYPVITLVVKVANNAPATVTNTTVVSGGGESNTANDTANDVTTIVGTTDLAIAKSHAGNFAQGQVGATYSLVVSNAGGAASTGTVSVVDTLPAGLTVTALAGTGWTCALATHTCTRADALAASSSFPTVTVTVNVSNTTAASVTNTATVSGGGDTNTANDTAMDVTTVTQVPDLTIAKSHVGNFTQGQTGVVYSMTVKNSGGASTVGMVTLLDTLPAGLTATAIGGTGWTCALATLTCSRSDALPGAAAYPLVTLSVNVATNAPATVTNSVTVSGGGEANTTNDTANDITQISAPPDLTISKTHAGNFSQGQTGASYSITVGNAGSGPTNGTVTVVDTLPAGLTAAAITGSGWTCTLATLTCTRADALAAAGSYPVITLTVSVASNAVASVTNTAVVSGGGELNTANDTASDVTTITPPVFTLTATDSSATVVSGQMATYPLVLNVGSAGLGKISFACSGLPADASCAFLPASVSQGVGQAPVQMTVATRQSGALVSAPVSLPLDPRRLIPLLAMLIAGIVWLGFARNSYRWNRGLALMVIALGVSAMSIIGCAGSGGGKTPAGSYMITITATSASGPSTTAIVTLVVTK